MAEKKAAFANQAYSSTYMKDAREEIERERREAFIDLKNEIYKKRSDLNGD